MQAKKKEFEGLVASVNKASNKKIFKNIRSRKPTKEDKLLEH